MFEAARLTRARWRIPTIAISSLGFCAFAWLFYERYYRWRDCFNELGRCYDPDGSFEVYTTAGQVWGWLALPFLAVLVVALARTWSEARDGGER